MTILPTRNTEWGFYGTARHHADPDAAWPIAFAAVARVTGASPEGVRDFLDSRHGRRDLPISSFRPYRESVRG